MSASLADSGRQAASLANGHLGAGWQPDIRFSRATQTDN